MDEQNQASSCCGGSESCCGHCRDWLKKHKFVRIILVIFLVLAALSLIKGERRGGKYWNDQQNNFTVSAQGKVFAKPDIANLTAGVNTEPQKTVSQATKMNTEKMNAVIKAAKGAGVDDKDIQTSNYNISPQYNWDNGQQTLIGYGVNNQVTIKIRDLEKVDDVIQAVTEAGANTVGGVNFTIDDQEKLKAEARKQAIDLAKVKAKEIAKEAGMKIGEIINVSETANVPTPYPMAYGRGGADVMMAKEVALAPTIEAGQQEVTVDVTLTYRVGKGW